MQSLFGPACKTLQWHLIIKWFAISQTLCALFSVVSWKPAVCYVVRAEVKLLYLHSQGF